jgi:hypothetical protein
MGEHDFVALMTGGSPRPRWAELASFAALITGRGRCAGAAGLSHSVAQNRKLARPTRFERVTFAFGGQRFRRVQLF